MPADISAHVHRAHADGGGWSNLPQRLDSDWMSDAGDSCTHHSFYEYITFYVHPNTDLSPSQNQRGQHIPALVPSKKIGTLRDGAACKANMRSQNSCRSLSWVVIHATECADVCGYTFLSCFFFFLEQRWLLKYQSVLYASMKLQHQRPPPPFSHKNPRIL